MKGRIINCSPHQDIYFLETHAKNEVLEAELAMKATAHMLSERAGEMLRDVSTSGHENNLENLFVSPAGREMLKYKPHAKLKSKINPNLEFFTTIQNGNRQSISSQESNKPNEKCDTTSSSSNTASHPSTSSTGDSHRSSIDLYEEAAAILGLSCSQTDDCRCIECQCHYFDFEEEIDFPTTGNEYGKLLNVDHTSSCSIQ